jgi:oxalate decarboxylase/phosphoglucose isomerase-like protein (cupin superfamily)
MIDVLFIDLREEIQEGPRGFSAAPWRDRVRVPGDFRGSLHLVSIRPGQVRGNHLHPGHREWLYFFSGRGIFIWEAEPGRLQEQEIREHFLIHIPPGVAHALKNIGPETGYLIAWQEASGPEVAELETVPRPLVR